ncbi:hypothetical protein LCGC14_1898200 [marine sediment metagenome]|uniref:Transcription regulator PadR N-terminal domain-containing protein n=1 Tax=marine sediment metagenome TaxID=412755 RepID=A0A0F9GKR0_9ZZZZ
MDNLSIKILKHLKKHENEETYQIIVDLGFSAKTGGKIRYRLRKLEMEKYIKKSGKLGRGYSGYGKSKRFFIWNITQKGRNILKK